MSDVMQRWLDDQPLDRTIGNTDALRMALDYGVTDRAVIDNAVALVEYAQVLYVRFNREVPFEQLVRSLLQGVQYPLEPYWWYRRWWHRLRRGLRR